MMPVVRQRRTLLSVTASRAKNSVTSLTALHERRAWCDESGGQYEIEPLRDEETRAVTGYWFRFARLTNAVFFKCRFETYLC
jgi:hypothetical protein